MRNWWGRKLMQAVWRIVGDVYELEQRRVLIDRPWEEDILHWVREQDGWGLHGHLPPSRARCPCPTSTGWCLGRARQLTQRPVGE